MPIYLGLDCGGSSCRAMAIDEHGQPLFHGQGGPANVASTPEGVVRRSLFRATDGCPHPIHVHGCFAGLVDSETYDIAMRLLQQVFPDSKVTAEPDYAAGLRACPEGTDVCVIAGTGSLICSRVDGKLVKSGGGGYLLGDPGSAFQFGRAALMAYVSGEVELNPKLGEMLSRMFATTEKPTVIQKVYKSATPAATLAKFLAALIYDAEAGEEYAMDTIKREMYLLSRIVTRHIAKHHSDLPEIRLGLAGGVWKTRLLRENFLESLHSQISTPITPLKATTPPVHGAAMLAMELA